MRHTRLLSLAVLVVGLLAIGVSSIEADGDGGKNKFTVVEHADSDTVADVGAAGDSLGDVLAFGNPIFNASNTTQVGRDQGYCIRTNVGESWECNWTVLLDNGSLTVEGPFYDDLQDSQLAITGGTGAYRNAAGEMTLHARNAAGTEFDFSYRVTQ